MMKEYMSFEKFWKENKESYIEYAKKLANTDYDEMNLGKFYSKIEIDTDDDFAFKDGETTFYVYGETQEEVLEKSIIFINELTLLYGSQSKWNWLKEEAIKNLTNKETSFWIGGNQQMNFNIQETTPSVNLKVKKVKP